MIQVLRGLVAGALAGCAASWVMNEFQMMRSSGAQGSNGNSEPGEQREPQERKEKLARQQESNLEENATVKTAAVISRNLFEHELTSQEKKIAGPIVHYAYGSMIGALYGGLCELLPVASVGLGMPFGAAVWLLGDEIAVPYLGLSRKPTEYPPQVHADALAAHFMYGATTDLLRRVLRHC